MGKRDWSKAPLEELAARVNQHSRRAACQGRQMLLHAKAAGRLLLIAKDRVPHGRWLPWLKEHFTGGSVRTAQVFMRIARKWVYVRTLLGGRNDPISLAGVLVHLKGEAQTLEGWLDAEERQPRSIPVSIPEPESRTVQVVTVVPESEPEPRTIVAHVISTDDSPSAAAGVEPEPAWEYPFFPRQEIEHIAAMVKARAASWPAWAQEQIVEVLWEVMSACAPSEPAASTNAQ